MQSPDLQALIELSEKCQPLHANGDGAELWHSIGPGGRVMLADFPQYHDYILALDAWFRANHSTLTAPTLPGAGGGDAERLSESEKDVAVAQAVGLAEYVERQAKGTMALAAKNYLSLPYAQKIAAILKDAALPPQQGG